MNDSKTFGAHIENIWGRVLRRHEDNKRLRTNDPETMSDRKRQKIVAQQRLPEDTETTIDSPLNEIAPPLMPRQDSAKKEDIKVIREDEVNAD